MFLWGIITNLMLTSWHKMPFMIRYFLSIFSIHFRLSAPELSHENRSNKEPSLYLWFCWQLQTFFNISVCHISFPKVLISSKKWTHISSSVTNDEIFEKFNLGNILSYSLADWNRTHFCTSVNVCGIRFCKIFCSCNIYALTPAIAGFLQQ